MRILLPDGVKQEIWRYVYTEADRSQYLDAGREDHGRFIMRLSRDQCVGERLREYMPDVNVATYIRHSILNQYMKDKRVLPRYVDDVLADVFEIESEEIAYDKSQKVSLHKLADDSYVAACRANANTWATGLRNLLLYVAAAAGLPPSDGRRFELAVLIFQHGTPLNGADRRLIEAALKLINVRCVWL